MRALIDLLLYSNAWIALGATALCWQTECLLFGRLEPHALWGFIFLATLGLYAWHRLLGMARLGAFHFPGRFEVMKRYQGHIAWYAGLSSAAAAVFFFLLPVEVQLGAIFPAAISLGYILPVLKGGRRLRDLGLIKPFLLALAWAWVTVALPAANRHWLFTLPALLMVMERAFFIFAIALPFDIRDLELDGRTQVRTIPAQLGIPRAKRLAAFSLLFMLACAYLNYRLDAYSDGVLFICCLSALLTYALIHFAERVRHDYYFSGLLDGMLILPFVLMVVFG